MLEQPKVIHGDCLEELERLQECSIDSLVTDPPAGISFMGKDWDGNKGGRDEWVSWLTCVMAECLRVLKPGAHALVWAIPRTSHWTMTALEDAGFEIRDVVTHLFGTGFPKSLDVSKAIDREAGANREVVREHVQSKTNPHIHAGSSAGQYEGSLLNAWRVTAPATDAARQWEGFGTALKPACEFWILCRKPISEKTVAKNVLKWGTGALNIDGCRIEHSEVLTGGTGTVGKHEGWDRPYMHDGQERQNYRSTVGRFPSHLILDEEAAAALDEQSGGCRSDSGGASRFFYCAKSSKADRGDGNTHPTVKSTTLMSYLVRLITPPGGLVLDPFMGSGSTGVAAKAEGMRFVGIEQDFGYVETARRRLAC